MPVSVTMPRLGESVTEGTVTRWLKQEGERVEADEPLLEVSTDKVDTEIPSPASGVLSRIVVAADETAEVGSELAVIDGEGESSDAAPAQPETVADTEAAAPVDTPSTEKEPETEARPPRRRLRRPPVAGMRRPPGTRRAPWSPCRRSARASPRVR